MTYLVSMAFRYWALRLGHTCWQCFMCTGSSWSSTTCRYYVLNHHCHQEGKLRLGRCVRFVHSHLARERQGKGLNPHLAPQPGLLATLLTPPSNFPAHYEHIQQLHLEAVVCAICLSFPIFSNSSSPLLCNLLRQLDWTHLVSQEPLSMTVESTLSPAVCRSMSQP